MYMGLHVSALSSALLGARGTLIPRFFMYTCPQFFLDITWCLICPYLLHNLFSVPTGAESERRSLGFWPDLYRVYTMPRLLPSSTQAGQSNPSTNFTKGASSWIRGTFRRLGRVQKFSTLRSKRYRA